MHAVPYRLAALAAAAIAVAAPLAAQARPRPTLAVTAGGVLPTGDFADAFKSGYTVGAEVGFGARAGSPLGIRLGGAFNRFDSKQEFLGEQAHANLLAFTGSLAYALGGSTPQGVRPYVVGGVGVYNIKTTLAGESDSDTKFGLNGGAGLELPLSGLSAFVEARLHYVFTDDEGGGGSSFRYVPIVVGLRF